VSPYECRPTAEFRQKIINEADNVARLYLAGKELGQPATREQKEVIEGILAADYEGRTLVELLQNGHDAHDPARKDGKLEFYLRESEGDYGVLYVANAGEPLTDEYFTSLCRIGMSPKRPDQGIGNKGVGFKSVLQLSDAPEIYSMRSARSDRFDGYCFRFAQHDDFTALAERISPGDPGLADELRENVASLKVPVPLDIIPDEVASFATRDFVTVVRLILRSAAAREKAAAQFTELVSSPVPFHLFLERVATITLRRVGTEDRTLTRSTRRVTKSHAVPIDKVHLQDGTSYLVFRRTVPEITMKEAISRSRHEGGFGSGWDSWQGDGVVRIAVPTGQALSSGRLYAFLPMGENATGPLAAFVNAPFFVQLDRRNYEHAVPLNDMLLSEAAALCAQVLVLAARNQLGVPDELLLDLACWRETDLHRLEAAVKELEEDITTLPILPPALRGGERVSVAEGRFWRSQGKVFHARAVSSAGAPELIKADLGRTRSERLIALAESLGFRLVPQDAELAVFAETFAASLAATVPDERTWKIWAQFYDDLTKEIRNGRHLRGRRVLIDAQQQLLAAADESGPSVFVASTASDTDIPSVVPPAAVSGLVVFTAPKIAWRDAKGHIRPGREWLVRHDLVQEYRTEPVLALVGKIMRDPATSIEDQSTCLRFAFELWRSARRRVGSEALRQARLNLPTVTGWRPASQTYFGPGWGGATADTDKALGKLLERAAAVSQELTRAAEATLLSADDVLEKGGDEEERRQFAEHLGARHGLSPLYYKRESFNLSGYQVASPDFVSDLPLPSKISDRTKRAWLTLAGRWPRQEPTYTGVQYRPTTNVATLPGQEDFDSFDPDSRRLYSELILRGLGTWPRSALEYSYARSTDSSRPAWPTLAAAFLSSAPWVPQTIPGDRSRIVFESPAKAWWMREAETPDYLPAQPPSLRALATPRVLARLAEVGVRFWDDPQSSGDRLSHLTNLIREGAEQRGNPVLAIRKAHEAAWRDLLEIDGSPPTQIIVSRQGELLVADLPPQETIYVPNEAGVTKERLLAQAPISVVAIRDRRLAARMQQYLEQRDISGLRSAADAEIDVTVDDDEPATEASVKRLNHYGGSWLQLLILAIVEYQPRGFWSAQSPQLEDARRLLDQLNIVSASAMTTTIDGYRIRYKDQPRSLLIEGLDGPRVVVSCGETAGKWMILETASSALAELIGAPILSEILQLALMKLERACGTADPTPEDIATVLNIPYEEINSLIADQGMWRSKLSGLLAILACLDVDLAEQFRAEIAGFDSPDAIPLWLRTHFSSHDPETLMAIAAREDLRSALDELGISMETANTGLRALGLPQLHNFDGHVRQLAAFLQRNRAQLRNHIRDCFVPAYRSGQPLEEYLRLLEATPEPDPTWLDRYWDVPEDVLEGYVGSWLEHVCPNTQMPPDSLPPIDDLREAGTRTITSVLANARVLIEAWLHRNASGQGRRPGERIAVATSMTAEGLLDFGRLNASDVIQWLQANDQWPTDMPLTTNRADLKLTDQDLESARSRLEANKEQQRRRETYVRYGDKTYSEDPYDLRALVDAVRAGVPAEVLSTPVDPVRLSLLPTAKEEHRSSGRAGSSSGSSTSRGPDEKLKAIGLAGEVIVGEWLRHHFGMPIEDTWVSGNRAEVIADGKGSDNLGYDFQVRTPDRTLLFEVKATVGDVPEFKLGESEVRRAQDIDQNEKYLIVFVTHVLSPEMQRIHILPNPLASGGLQHYHVAGNAMRFKFELRDS
jgi:hypothetical protein